MNRAQDGARYELARRPRRSQVYITDLNNRRAQQGLPPVHARHGLFLIALPAPQPADHRAEPNTPRPATFAPPKLTP